MLFAQQDFIWDYAVSYPQTAIKAVSAPLSWETKDWLKAGAVGLTAGALYFYDEDIRDFSQRNRSTSSDALMTGFKQFGEGIYVVPAIGITILGGYIADSNKTMDTGLLCLKSFVLAESATQILKYASQRNRPSANKGKELWRDSHFHKKQDSFPSGHTTLVWSIAPILAEQYKDARWVAPTVYSISFLTSYSRVNDNNHWSSDAYVGAVIGYVTAKLVLKDTPSLTIYPHADLAGISFQYQY